MGWALPSYVHMHHALRQERKMHTRMVVHHGTSWNIMSLTSSHRFYAAIVIAGSEIEWPARCEGEWQEPTVESPCTGTGHLMRNENGVIVSSEAESLRGVPGVWMDKRCGVIVIVSVSGDILCRVYGG
jgi:hypothetical protein